MQVVLSPRFVLIEQGEVVFLTDRRGDEKIWPEDVFQPFPNWGFRPAAEHARRMARTARLKPEQRKVVERFCDSLPKARDPGSSPDPPEIRRVDP